MLDKLKVYAKAVGGFLTALAGFAALLLADPNVVAVFPAPVLAWLAAVAGAGALAAVVAALPNKLTKEQILKGAREQGVAVGTAAVSASADAVTNAVQSYIEKAARDVPKPAKDQVQEIASAVPDLVAGTINDFLRGAVK